jgi:glycosyltransferase involved in cell wall biosynthesis
MKKKILAHFDFFPPRYNAGAERYALAMFKYLIKQGHEVKVLTQPAMGPNGYEYEGIKVYTSEKDHLDELYEEADYVVTQIAYSGRVRDFCRRKNKKLIYLVHNTKSIGFWGITPADVWLTVWNADWVRDYTKNQLKWIPSNHDATLYPPTLFEDYQVPEELLEEEKPYDVCLVNLCVNKGIHCFIQAAKMNPDKKFLGVIGAYEDQVIKGLPPNVTVTRHTPNMVKDVYSKVKILIMPSKKETWGMVALEAMCSGIPVIAHPTEGLTEACGSAGLFVHRDKAYIWDGLIKKLLSDSDYYEAQGERCIARAKELDAIVHKQLENIERIIAND